MFAKVIIIFAFLDTVLIIALIPETDVSIYFRMSWKQFYDRVFS